MAIRHVDRVLEAVRSYTGTAAAGVAMPSGALPSVDHLITSWRRCLEEFQLDPNANLSNIPQIGNRELNLARDALEERLSLAMGESNEAYAALSGIGYSVSVSDHEGLFVLERADRNSAHYVSTDQPGWIWTENVGGTNSVGTCIADQKPVSVFHDQHFLSILTDTACAGAPLFDPSGAFWGVLSITIRDPNLEPQTHYLATQVLKQAAQRLNTRLFQQTFSKSTVLDWRNEGGASCLIAINSDQRIEAANLPARRLLDLGDAAMLSKPLWSIFEKHPGLRTRRLEPSTLELRQLNTGKLLQVSVIPAHPRRYGIEGRSSTSRSGKSNSESLSIEDCAGKDPMMLENVRLLRRVRDCGLPILLLGETGTGKDKLARAIHSDSNRATKPFVAFNCAAIPESLIDSELFGYAPGAFTGANPRGNQGRILEANGGTLFLDEIGDMPIMLQTRLLRVLEAKEVIALGTGSPQEIDVQIIAATNQDLQQRVEERRFREDLYYRLAGMVVHLPPLRLRADLEWLIDRILGLLSGNEKRLEPSARMALLSHHWPGNIRELTHALRRAVSLSCDEWITVTEIMPTPSASGQNRSKSRTEPVGQVDHHPATVHDAVSRAEASSIRAVLESSGGDVEKSAQLLGVSRATLYRKMRRHQLR